jgi:primosomal protein N' (replication factor Y) (superfamily II helicase)
MSVKTCFIDVIVPLAVPKKFSYRVPTHLAEEVAIGKRVLVQFGKTRVYTGIIAAITDLPPKGYEAKYIEAVLDEHPVVNELQLQFWEWLAFYYCANIGDVMNAALPSGLKLSSTSHIQLNNEFNFEELAPDFFTEREHFIIELLHQQQNLSLQEVSDALKLKTIQPLVQALLKKKAIEMYEEVKEKFKPKQEVFYQLSEAYRNEKALHDILNKLEKKSFKQAEALLYFLHLSKTDKLALEWVSRKMLSVKTETAALTALVKKGVLLQQSFDVARLQFDKNNEAFIKPLTEAQNECIDLIHQQFQQHTTILLKGITGSGKTEVYIHLIQEQLKQDKQILFLVPEIALTTQLILRLRSAFGSVVGIYHSRFSEQERVEVWNEVLKGKNSAYKIIIGARSSLFLPYNQLGLIIIDEEHDFSFKQQDPAPRYHARDAALYLANKHGAKVLLGSATPSLETYYNATQKKYGYVELNTPYSQTGGTSLELCDLKVYEQSSQMKSSLTPPLFNAIQLALMNKEQVILFQNRRGFAPYTECKQCAHVPHCVQCDVALIYHKQTQKLSCHYCGYTINPLKTCPSCGGTDLRFKGLGTEKIEEDIEVLFPNAKIGRMDLDSTRSKHAYKQLIDDFEARNIDILIGTQMVTKGLDFDNVTVVGILNADSLLTFPDFRSHERAYQLITQVRGRAGRKEKPGRVFVQTNHTQHAVLNYVATQNWKLFYEEQLKERAQYNYPPFSRLMEISIADKSVNEVNAMAHEFGMKLKAAFSSNVLGPEFPIVSKIKNLYYKRLLIKLNRNDSPQKVRQCINEQVVNLYFENKSFKGRVIIDVDPF